MRRVIALAIVAMLLAPAPVSAMNRPERALATMTNEARVNHGVRPLDIGWRLSRDAGRHALKMAEAGRIFHGTTGFGDGRRCWGQNVGVGQSAKNVFRAFMRSLDHRANILDRCFRYAGFGVVRRDGFVWVVQNFASP